VSQLLRRGKPGALDFGFDVVDETLASQGRLVHERLAAHRCARDHRRLQVVRRGLRNLHDTLRAISFGGQGDCRAIEGQRESATDDDYTNAALEAVEGHSMSVGAAARRQRMLCIVTAKGCPTGSSRP
jgi:hypothetical protein